MTRRGVLLLIALGIVWGIPYLFIRVAVAEVSPAFIVFTRVTIAAIVLIPIALARRDFVSTIRRYWKPILGYAIAEVTLPWFFLGAAEQRLPSSTTALLLAAIPIAGVGVAWLFGRRDRFGWVNWAGIVLGALGVAALVGLDVATDDLPSVLLLIITVIGYAVGPAILAKWMPEASGIALTAWTFAIVAVIYLPVVSFTGGWPTALPSGAAIVALLVLALVCSVVAFLILPLWVAEVGPARTGAVAYVNPAVAIAAGAIFLGEAVTWWTIVGFVLVLGGSFLVTYRRRRTEAVAAEGAEAAPVVAEAEVGVEVDGEPCPEAGAVG